MATIYGTVFSENIAGGIEGDVIRGYAEGVGAEQDSGNDTLRGGGGRDILYGGAGDDLLRGGGQTDTLFGGAGDDRLVGSIIDSLVGGAGNDRYEVFDPYVPPQSGLLKILVDEESGPSGGRDHLVVSGRVVSEQSVPQEAVRYELPAGIEDVTIFAEDRRPDRFVAVTAVGSVVDNRIFVRAGGISVTDTGGDDTIYVQASGSAEALAGDGNDRIVSLDDPSITRTIGDFLVGDNGDDTVFGSDAVGFLLGGAGRDRLYGRGGNDTINGGAGIDILIGGAGDDRLTGDGPNGERDTDTFLFEGAFGNDTITDYRPGRDRIDLRRTGLTAADLLIEDVDTDGNGTLDSARITVAELGTIVLLGDRAETIRDGDILFG